MNTNRRPTWALLLPVVLLSACALEGDPPPTEEANRFSGIVRTVYVESFDPPSSERRLMLEEEGTGRLLDVVFSDSIAHMPDSGSRISVQGVLEGPNELLALGESLVTEVQAPLRGRSSRPVRERVMVIPVQVAGQPSSFCDFDRVERTVFGATDSVASVLAEASGGQVVMTGTVSRVPVSVPSTGRPCDIGFWATVARGRYLAIHGRRSLDDYNRVVYIVPACGGWAGMGEVASPGARSRVWIADSSSCNGNVYEHELGHGFGLGHAAVPPEACRLSGIHPLFCEYGDYSDTMSNYSQMLSLNAPHHIRMGWRDDDQIQEYRGGESAFTLTSLDAAAVPGGTQIIHAPIRSLADVYVSYRTVEGANSRMRRDFGRQVHVHTWQSGQNTYLQARLAAGESYVDRDRGVTVVFDALTAGGAQVRLTRMEVPPTPPSTEPVGAILNVSRRTVTGWAYDPDLGEGPVSVRIMVNGALAGSGLADRRSRHAERAVPGAGRRHKFKIRIPRLGAGTYRVDVVVTDHSAPGVADGENFTLGTRWVTNRR